MTERKKVVLFDIDGTVADLRHRLHFITNGNNDWASFNANIPGDKPIEQTIFLNYLFRKNAAKNEDLFDVIFASGRSENERAMTEQQLKDFGCYYKKLYMRPAGDTRADYIIKREILDQIRADGYEPWIVIDDRQTVVDMWRENGLFVLQCDPGKAECRSDTYKFHKDISHPLTIMVGPSGAGKTTWINGFNLYDKNTIISSDALRWSFTGSPYDQSANARVFEAMLEIADKRLKLGLPVVLDATHIRRKDRVNALKVLPNDLKARYVVVDRPLDEKLKTKDWRDEELVRRHDQVFKSNLKDILRGDDFANVTVVDTRKKK